MQFSMNPLSVCSGRGCEILSLPFKSVVDEIAMVCAVTLCYENLLPISAGPTSLRPFL